MPLLFDYYLATDPQPLQAGEEAIQFNGILNMHVAEGSTTAYGNQITLAVPVGDNGLFQQPPACAVNTGKWVITAMRLVKGREIGLSADQDYAQFILNCQSPTDFAITYNLVVSLAGAVTTLPGQYDVSVLENSATVNDPTKFSPNSGSFSLSVVSPQFYLKNLVATATGSPTVPTTEFTAGATINLAWESNGTWFQVYKKGDTAPFWTGSQTTCSLPQGVATDTTFFVIGSMTGDPSQDQPTAGFTTIFLFESLTVTITNPVLTPTSVTTSANVAVGGNLTVAGTTNLTGQATLTSASVGSLTATGPSALAGVSVSGALGVLGNTSLATASVSNGLSVTGGATIGGGLSGTGSAISMLTGPTGVQPGTYTAATDGFVIGTVWWPGGDIKTLCRCVINGSTDGIGVNATGGTYAQFDSSWNKWNGGSANSFIMPVRKGASWTVSVTQDPSNQSAGSTAFFWFPLGSNAGAATFTRVSDRTPQVVEPPPSMKRIQRSKDPYIAELLQIIGLLAERPISPELRQRLLGVLTKLNSDEFDVE